MAWSEPVRLFSTDLDGTLIGNPESARRFKSTWENLPRKARPLLAYNSGRLVADLSRFVDSGVLPAADFYIGGVGTQVFEVAAQRMLEELRGHLATGWDLSKVRGITARFPGVRQQADELQHEFKSSWFLDRASPAAIRELSRQFADAGLSVKVVYSSMRDLDILPFNATKGGALAWLCARLALPLGSVLVAGDTGNDASMFRLPGVRGILVGNALPELFEAAAASPTFASRRIQAEGVLDGLRHYGVIDAAPSNRRPSAEPIDKFRPPASTRSAADPPARSR